MDYKGVEELGIFRHYLWYQKLTLTSVMLGLFVYLYFRMMKEHNYEFKRHRFSMLS